LLLEQRLVIGYEVEASQQSQFENWNKPEDLNRG
jgi:hypothetical protein